MSKQQLPQAAMSIFALPTAVPRTAKQGTQSTNLEGTGTAGIALLTHLPLGAHTNVTNH